jgi:hypothetical protein
MKTMKTTKSIQLDFPGVPGLSDAELRHYFQHAVVQGVIACQNFKFYRTGWKGRKALESIAAAIGNAEIKTSTKGVS